MVQKRLLARIGLLAASAMLLITSGITWAQQYCGHRSGAGRFGSAIRNGYRGPYAAGTGNQPWACPPGRHYDSTGRWTGDGVDTMSTAKPTWQQTTNSQPKSPN